MRLEENTPFHDAATSAPLSRSFSRFDIFRGIIVSLYFAVANHDHHWRCMICHNRPGFGISSPDRALAVHMVSDLDVYTVH